MDSFEAIIENQKNAKFVKKLMTRLEEHGLNINDLTWKKEYEAKIRNVIALEIISEKLREGNLLNAEFDLKALKPIEIQDYIWGTVYKGELRNIRFRVTNKEKIQFCFKEKFSVGKKYKSFIKGGSEIEFNVKKIKIEKDLEQVFEVITDYFGGYLKEKREKTRILLKLNDQYNSEIAYDIWKAVARPKEDYGYEFQCYTGQYYCAEIESDNQDQIFALCKSLSYDKHQLFPSKTRKMLTYLIDEKVFKSAKDISYKKVLDLNATCTSM